MRNALKILIVSNFAPPQNNIAVGRIHSWIRDWSKEGHQVTVLTTKKVLGRDGKLDGESFFKDYDPDRVRFVEVPYEANPTHGQVMAAPFKRPISAPNPRNLLRMLFPFLLDRRAKWAMRVLRDDDYFLDSTKFDVVVSSFPICHAHIIARTISNRMGIPWIADYRDPWSCDRMRRGPWPLYLIDFLLERFLIRQASRITAVSPGQSQLIGNWLNRKVDVIYNGSDASGFAEQNSFKSINQSEFFVIRYIGTVYDTKQHSYIEFFDALKHSLIFKSGLFARIRFEFIGPRSETLIPLITAQGLDQVVSVHPTVSFSQAQKLMSESGALLFFDIKDPKTAPGVLSGKIFDYFAARRPILSVCTDSQSAVNRLIEQANAGVIFNYTNKNLSLVSALEKVLIADNLGAPSYTSLVEFQRGTQSQKMLDLIFETLRARQNGEAAT
jgi:hypothetical protein